MPHRPHPTHAAQPQPGSHPRPQPEESHGMRTGAAAHAAVDALVDNLRSETRLLEELATLMRRRREAVIADDAQGVDDSVYATQRVLLTLGQARRRRRSLNCLLGESEDLAPRALEQALGSLMTDALRQARDGLQAAALALSHEVDLSRQVMREALAAGDSYLRNAYRPAESTPRCPTDGSQKRGNGLFLVGS